MNTNRFTQLKYKDLKKLRILLLKKQNGKCLICNSIPKRACVDHSHKKKVKGTGRIRGVLCSNCNVMLAKIENNATRYCIKQSDLPKILRSIASYLEKPHLKYIHPTEAPKKKKLKKSSYNKLKKLMEEANKKCPNFPKSGTLTKPLKKAFEKCNLTPEFYK
jgi:hypothetical protein